MSKKKIYTYKTKKGTIFDFEIVKETDKNYTVLILDEWRLFNIPKDELKKAAFKHPENLL